MMIWVELLYLKKFVKTMNINNSDLLDIYINEDGVCIKKYVSKNDYKEYIIILKDTIPAELSLKNKQLILQKLTDVLHILEKH